MVPKEVYFSQGIIDLLDVSSAYCNTIREDYNLQRHAIIYSNNPPIPPPEGFSAKP